ncbi:MAG: NnrU family protein, partial [Acidobacteriota bacterium]
IIGPYHLDARHKRNKGEEFTEFCKQTSVLPFGAILRGRNRLALDELSFPLALISTAAFVALLLFHSRFFGGELY